MERIEDLNLMVTEAKRMAATVKAFEKIPRVLGLLQSSSKVLDDLAEEETRARATLEGLKVAIEQVEADRGKVVAEISGARETLNGMRDEINQERNKLMAGVKTEVEKKRASLEQKLDVTLKDLEGQTATKRAELDAVIESIDIARKDHEANMKQYAQLEADAQKKVAAATKNLEKIKKSLFGGNE